MSVCLCTGKSNEFSQRASPVTGRSRRERRNIFPKKVVLSSQRWVFKRSPDEHMQKLVLKLGREEKNPLKKILCWQQPVLLLLPLPQFLRSLFSDRFDFTEFHFWAGEIYKGREKYIWIQNCRIFLSRWLEDFLFSPEHHITEDSNKTLHCKLLFFFSSTLFWDTVNYHGLISFTKHWLCIVTSLKFNNHSH